MKKKRLLDIQDRDLFDFDRRHIGEFVRISITTTANFVRLYVRDFNHETGHFGKVRLIGAEAFGCVMFANVAIGSIVTEMHVNNGFPSYKVYAVSITDHNSSYLDEHDLKAWTWYDDPEYMEIRDRECTW